MLETLEAMSGVFIGILLIGIFISTFFIKIASVIAAISNTGLKKPLIAAVSVSVVLYGASLLFFILLDSKAVMGFTVGLFVSFFIIKKVFDSSYSQAFLIWVFNIIAQIAAVSLGAKLILGGVRYLFKII